MRKICKRYWPLILVIAVYLICLTIYFCNFHSGFSKEKGEWGTFGDFFGGTLSPLIGIISIILTYDVIKNQSQETKQSEFKNIFQILFDGIPEKENIIETKKRIAKKGVVTLVGQKALFRINKDIEAVYQAEKRKKSNTNIPNIDIFKKSFWTVYDNINGSSSPFMKILHNCLKAIDNHCLEERQEAYSSLLRAQLHKDELIFIFYNAISSEDFSDFKKRVEKYSILKDLVDYKFPDGIQDLRELYNASAFIEDKKVRTKIEHHNTVFSFELNFTFNKK
ncbi:putative phage abortive infection protein [Flavobacterium ginsengiterrae]|uniref:Phage abortive infection protein n=1 Tax=Flavobacterium ginsengiterrae TaxID=871695 RepID=A0ABP7GSF5_9FLAO